MKNLETFAAKNNLIVKTVKFRSHGIKLKRHGYDLCKKDGQIIATFEPCDYSNGDKWKLTGHTNLNSGDWMLFYFKRITIKILNSLNLEHKSYLYNSSIIAENKKLQS